MKPNLLTILLLTSLTLNSQTIDLKHDFSKVDKYIMYAGSAMLLTEFTFDKPETQQEFNFKVVKCLAIVFTTGGVLIANDKKKNKNWKFINGGICRTINNI